MRLVAFRVLNYRCVNDSGWVEVGRLSVLLGKNQSGKTTLLTALHKLNTSKHDPYDLDREWPRGRRRERDPSAPAAMARFAFTPEERQTLRDLVGAEVPGTVEVARSYDGTPAFAFPGGFNPDAAKAQELAARVYEIVRWVDSECSAGLRAAARDYVRELEQMAQDHKFSELAWALQVAQQRLVFSVSTEEPAATRDQEVLEQITQTASSIARACLTGSGTAGLENKIAEWLPVFVYMDDYRRYTGSAILDQLKTRRDRNELTEEDETVLVLMSMAGLDLDEQVAGAESNDRQQRVMDLNDASVTLTKEMAGRWSQGHYEVQFQADQYHFMTFIRSSEQSVLVPLEEESKGFQWFFSFDLHFAHGTQGTLEGAVLLLDEPGLHLHPEAQADLLRRLEAYSEGNQLIYVTHQPFMVDRTKPERIKVVERGEQGTVVRVNAVDAPPSLMTRIRRRLRGDALFFSIAGTVFLLDQATKSAVRLALQPGESVPVEGWVRLTHVTNTGAAFGLFTDQSVFLLLTTLVGVAAITIYYFFPPANSPFLTSGLGLQLGGALGNLLDRIRLGHVTDFLDFRVWPVFNVADSAIVTGVVLLVIFFLLSERRPA